MSCPQATSSLPLLFAAAVLAQEPTPSTTPRVLPIEGLTVLGEQRWLTARVLDAIDGQPVPGTEVLLVAESRHPLRGEFWSSMRGEADADGFVAMRVDQAAPGYAPWSWVVVRAPGHAPVTSMNAFEGALVRLPRGLTLPVRVCDQLGRPVPDALVGFCGGCGHSPDLVHGRTNAAGVVHLADVDRHSGFGDLYIEHPDLHLGYEDARWFPGEGPFDFFVRRGVRSRGLVVDDAGQPIAGAYVGTMDRHRGPWTRTGADGGFALYGSEAASDLWVHVGEREILFERPLADPMRLQLPPDDGKGGKGTQTVDLPRPAPPSRDGAQTATALFRALAANGSELTNPRLRCYGPLPAREEIGSGPYDGGFAVVLRHGRYEVIASGDDHAELRQVLEVTPDGDNDFTLRPARLPGVVVRIPDLPDYLLVDLVTANGSRDIAPLVRQGALVALPDEPFHIVLHSSRSRRAFAPDRAQALAAGVLRLRWFAPTHVEGQLVDARGEPIEAKVALLGVGSFRADEFAKQEGTRSTGALALTSDDVGLRLLTVLADGHRHPRIVPIVLPPRGDDVVVDVGTIVVGGAPRLLLQDADGEGLVDAKASLLRPGWSDMNEGGLAFPVDAGGEWFGPDPQAGDAIVVAARAVEEPAAGALPEQDLDVRFPITGQGPWTLRLPAGELDVDVRDEGGKELTANVFVGSECVEVVGPTRLRRVWPGPQRLFVAADDHQSAIVDVTVPTSGRAKVKVVLPKR